MRPAFIVGTVVGMLAVSGDKHKEFDSESDLPSSSPLASDGTTGQGKWQVGPAAGGGLRAAPLVAWSAGAKSDLVRGRFDSAWSERLVSSTVYNLPAGSWMVLRSEPQVIFDWKTNKQLEVR